MGLHGFHDTKLVRQRGTVCGVRVRRWPVLAVEEERHGQHQQQGRILPSSDLQLAFGPTILVMYAVGRGLTRQTLQTHESHEATPGLSKSLPSSP